MIGFPTLASVSELLEENQIGKAVKARLLQPQNSRSL